MKLILKSSTISEALNLSDIRVLDQIKSLSVAPRQRCVRTSHILSQINNQITHLPKLIRYTSLGAENECNLLLVTIGQDALDFLFDAFEGDALLGELFPDLL